MLLIPARYPELPLAAPTDDPGTTCALSGGDLALPCWVRWGSCDAPDTGELDTLPPLLDASDDNDMIDPEGEPSTCRAGGGTRR